MNKIQSGQSNGGSLNNAVTSKKGWEVIAETGKLSAKGQVAIPIKVREEMGVKEGDRLEFLRHGDVVIVRPIKRKSIKDAFGSWKNTQPLKDVQELRDQFRKELIDDDRNRQAD